MDKLDKAFANLEAAETTNNAILKPEEPTDEFQADIKATAKVLLTSIKSSASGAYALEAKELANLASAVCSLQNTFYGKDDKTAGTMIMTNQLSVFKGMLK